MSHLSDQETTAFLDDDLEASRARHLAGCAECGARLDEARAALALVRGVDVPEPSPLFWDHFSRRVSEAIASEPPPRAAPRWRFAWMPLTAVGALAAIAVGSMWLPSRPAPAPQTEIARDATAAGPAAMPAPAPAAISADQEWVLVLGVAEGADWDAVVDGGLQVTPGSADSAALGLTVEEREELGRLLQAELSRFKVL
jgi:hypothetical protein